MIVSLRDVEAFAASYDRMRERIRRDVAALASPESRAFVNAFGIPVRVSPLVPSDTVLIVDERVLRSIGDDLRERARTARHCLDRDVVTVPDAMSSFRHPIEVDVPTIRYEHTASPEFSAVRVCETRHGATVCACGRYAMTWSRDASEVTFFLAQNPFPPIEDPADWQPFGAEGTCGDIPGADDAKAEASTLRDAGVPAVRVDEYQRRLSSLLGGRRLV